MTLEHLESKDFLYPGTNVTMHEFFHKLSRCSICRNIGFLPRDPFPAKKLSKVEQRRRTKSLEKAQKVRVLQEDAYETFYD